MLLVLSTIHRVMMDYFWIDSTGHMCVYIYIYVYIISQNSHITIIFHTLNSKYQLLG